SELALHARVSCCYNLAWRISGLSFFFQAEDGIRDFHVTGVQTCALPISDRGVGVELGIVSDALVEARTVEYGADLEGNPGECKGCGDPTGNALVERLDIVAALPDDHSEEKGRHQVGDEQQVEEDVVADGLAGEKRVHQKEMDRRCGEDT